MIGSLGLFRHLAALGRAAPAGSAADLNKRMARLSEDAKLRFKALRAEEKAKIDAARMNAQTAFDRFLAENGMPPRADYRKEREVVSAFVRNESASAAGLSTDGYVLKVGSREVARRDSPTSRFVKVCPGKFGEDKVGRRAANAALDILGAGVRVDDKVDTAFLRARGGGRGVVSPEVCYTVEVSGRVRKAAERGLMSNLDAERAAAFAPGGELEQYYAAMAAKREEGRVGSRAMDGLGRATRRSSRRRKSHR